MEPILYPLLRGDLIAQVLYSYIALVLNLNKSKSFLSSVGMYFFDYFVPIGSKVSNLKVSRRCWA